MKYFVLWISLFFAHFSSAKPLIPEEALAAFRLETDDLQVSLVAAEPEVVDPVALCFDSEGRLFVVESRGYPHPGKGFPDKKEGICPTADWEHGNVISFDDLSLTAQEKVWKHFLTTQIVGLKKERDTYEYQPGSMSAIISSAD